MTDAVLSSRTLEGVALYRATTILFPSTQGGRPPAEEGDVSGKGRVRAIVAEMAARMDLDPDQIMFSWIRKKLFFPAYGLELAETIYNLRLRASGASEVLTLAASCVQASTVDPGLFVRAYQHHIEAALKRLKTRRTGTRDGTSMPHAALPRRRSEQMRLAGPNVDGVEGNAPE